MAHMMTGGDDIINEKEILHNHPPVILYSGVEQSTNGAGGSYATRSQIANASSEKLLYDKSRIYGSEPDERGYDEEFTTRIT